MLSELVVTDLSVCLLLSHAIVLLTFATVEELSAAYFPYFALCAAPNVTHCSGWSTFLCFFLLQQ